MSTQQTILRVQFDNVSTSTTGITQYEILDIYSSIPIKINKSFAELQDISKRNSDYSIDLQLPGSKKNNRFFESFFNVDIDSLYFNPNNRVQCDVLINDESYFSGYLKLNKISVLDSKVEYSVTLFSTVGDLFGLIGNNQLKDLNFNTPLYGYSPETSGDTFNHIFNQMNVQTWEDFNPLWRTGYNEPLYFYPVVHNGYLYTGDTVNLSGSTVATQTRLYTTTKVGSWTSTSAAYSAGVERYRINSPEDGIIDNQLKPALNIKGLITLIFKTYGYTIKSDFFNTPWFRLLYMYGYFNSDSTKFTYKISQIPTLPKEGVTLLIYQEASTVSFIVTQTGTGIPCYCSTPIQMDAYTNTDLYSGFIQPQTSGFTMNGSILFDYDTNVPSCYQGSTNCKLAYSPKKVGEVVPFLENDPVNFSLVIDPLIKQIDLLSSIAKKFNLVFVPDPDVKNQIIIEPYTYFIGTGNVHDWTDLISYDKGWTVEPALNYVETNLILSDLDDGDYGNKVFKDQNNRLYGQNNIFNPTQFKSQEKKIETIFSPQVIRKWDTSAFQPNGGVKLPLGINYSSTSSETSSGTSSKVTTTYKGVKTKPKLMYYMGNFSPFIDTYGESLLYSGYVLTNQFVVSKSDGTLPRGDFNAPVISHTMPIGNNDDNKGPLRGFENDSICNLFNSEQPIDIGTVSAFDTYTNNDIYYLFYQNRVDNLYDANTRFLSGYFYLKYSDIKNLKPNDLIKIQEQYFTWNKIEGYNLTNTELTKVELIQTNNVVNTYPTRYFKYYYCDNPTVIFKFKTYFTNPSMVGTNFNWSVVYDYNVGILGGNVTGYTTTIQDYQPERVYVGYTTYEVTEDEYNSSGLDRSYDTLWNELSDGNYYFNFRTYMYTNSVPSSIYMNLFSGCTDYYEKTNILPFYPGSSTYYGPVVTPTPTPTPSPTPSPTPLPTNLRGSLIFTFDQTPNYKGIDRYTITVNGQPRVLNYSNNDNLYTTYIYSGDSVTITISPELNDFSVYRRDYTTDDQGGDMGIRDVFITGNTSAYSISFTVTTSNIDYNFEYRVSGTTYTGVTYNILTEDTKDLNDENNNNLLTEQNII